MKIYKNKDITTSIDTEKMGINNSDTHFYTEDKGSAALRIFINHRKTAFNLDKTTLTPILDLFHSDGSIWLDEPLEVIMSDKGILQYNIPDNVIAHAGRVKAKLFLRNAEQSVHVANFTFDIKDSGIEGAVEKEISVNIVDEAVRRIVKENAIEILGDDFEQRLNTDVINHLDSNPELFKGDDGKDFKYTDLTDSQLNELKSNITDQAVTDFVISDNSITPDKTTFFEFENSTNLLDVSTIKKNTSVDTDGVEVEDSKRWLTDFIPLDSSIQETINATEGSYRLALYDENKKFTARAGFNGTKYTPHTATKTKYVRLSGSNELSTLMINKGSELLPFEEYYGTQTKLKQEFLPLQSDDNNSSETLLPSDLAKIEQNIQTYTPSLPKLEFEEVTTGYYEALWLSKDGKRVYGKQGARLWVSYDECETFTTVIDDTGTTVQGVR